MTSSIPRRSFLAPRDGFFGRVEETAEILILLGRPDISCLTIMGPGGVGKTRLAQQVATALAADSREPFTEGIWFVPLAATSEAHRVPAEIARVLGLEMSDDDPESALIDYLNERDTLLILDNAEQVIDIADLVSRIAINCPDTKIIVTSRRPLRISGEQEYALAPLPLPVPGESETDSPAVALFIQRAQMVNPMIEFDDCTLSLVADICRQLDGLPLAIELAASRVKALSPAVLLTQLNNRLRILTSGPRDAPLRQQTLRSTIGWSYDILTSEEQSLFRRLSVFTGGFSFEAAEKLVELCDLDTAGVDSLDLIASLVDHSLVLPTDGVEGDPRWTMLETIREFGLEQLAAKNEELSTRAAHAEIRARISEGAELGMYGSEQATWIRRLTAEESNIRSALTWANENGKRELALRIAGPLWRYWSFQHLGHEGRNWIKRALEMPGDTSPVPLGVALRGAGCLAEDIGEYPAAERFHQQARQIWEELGDHPRLSRTLDDLGNVAHDQGDFATAIDLHNQAYEVAKACGHRRGMTNAMSNLGATAYLQGDLKTARERWQGVIDSGVIDDPIGRAMVLNNLGVACMQMGDLDQATAYLEQALAIHRGIGTQSTTADIFINMSDIATRQGNLQQSEAYFEEGIDLYRKADDPKGLHNAYYSLGCTEVDRSNPNAALLAFAEALRYADRANNRIGLADTMEQIASFAVDSDRASEAARLAGTARSIRDAMHAVELPGQKRFNSALIEKVRTLLGDHKFDEAFAAGQATPHRQATTRALELAEEMSAKALPSRTIRVQNPVATNPFKLTKREIEVLRLLAEGKSYRDIAAALWISPRTAGTHVANILAKLEVDTRAAAVAAAFRHNLLG